MEPVSERTALLSDRSFPREQEGHAHTHSADTLAQHTLELTLAVCQVVPETEEPVVTATVISDLANKALQIISLRNHCSHDNGGAVGETAHSLLRAAARCATRAREDTFRRSLWQVRQHVCVKAALESLFRLANQRREVNYNSMAQVSGIDDDITDRMLIYANGLLVPHPSHGHSVLDFALKTGLDEILQNDHVQCCIEALWHGDIVPVWPMLDGRFGRRQDFWLERANDDYKPPQHSSTGRLASAGRKIGRFLEGLLRPERALAPIYYGMLSGLGYAVYTAVYMYLLMLSDYRWGNWSAFELVVYGWSLLYIVEINGKLKRQRLLYFRRVKHWCEFMAHGMLVGSAILRWRTMHTSNKEHAYYYARWSALLFSSAALPLAVRTLAAFDWAAMGSGGLARVFRMFDRVAHEIAWTVVSTAVVLAGLGVSIAGMNGDVSPYTTILHVVQGAMFDAFQFMEIDGLDPLLAPWLYRATLILVWLILGNLMLAINVAVYHAHIQSNMQAIPRMERLAAGTLRSLCAPARHAFPVPWLLVVIVVIWPIEKCMALAYRLRARAHPPAQPLHDEQHDIAVAVEDDAVAQRKHTSSGWRLAIWWMTVGWLTLLVDIVPTVIMMTLATTVAGRDYALGIAGLVLHHPRYNGLAMIDGTLNREHVFVTCEKDASFDRSPYHHFFRICREYEAMLDDEVVRLAGCPQYIRRLPASDDYYYCYVSQGIDTARPRLLDDVKVNRKTAEHIRATIVGQIKQAVKYAKDGTIKFMDPAFHRSIGQYNAIATYQRDVRLREYFFKLFRKFALPNDQLEELVQEAAQDLYLSAQSYEHMSRTTI
ncbi:hypothetical protein SYNPS1DRAFT_28880 [Syncephalis pseudoplumigaleata]|uniref:Uncharacterized protein n=1 Tax=Syncephalis pseudoplumigaleata TaxID=1712513 RepID=A0A4P9YZK7_9FUNG|nr:hypothetical protein SYNPS1DRAFT_28880 [Syncephalis pseudoplumigaleata]|eukprot:RKP25385.1 hypothetical protein SYNPS1DRAFT_28880 [Syncephalis pseudoplumigaleata]